MDQLINWASFYNLLHPCPKEGSSQTCWMIIICLSACLRVTTSSGPCPWTTLPAVHHSMCWYVPIIIHITWLQENLEKPCRQKSFLNNPFFFKLKIASKKHFQITSIQEQDHTTLKFSQCDSSQHLMTGCDLQQGWSRSNEMKLWSSEIVISEIVISKWDTC